MKQPGVMPAPADAALSLQGLCLGYQGRVLVPPLHGCFRHGTMTAVIGPNGAGKSTLLATLAGAAPPGCQVLQGRAVHDPSLTRAWLPQRMEVAADLPVRVHEFVALGLWAECGWWRPVGAAGRRRVLGALQAVGLAALAPCWLDELSVGQRQRVQFARLLLQITPRPPALLLLDEPFAAVDEAATADLLALLQRCCAEGCTVVAVVHDPQQVRAAFAHTLRLGGEQPLWDDAPCVPVPAAVCMAPE